MKNFLQKKIFLGLSVFSIAVVFLVVGLFSRNPITKVNNLQDEQSLEHEPKQDRPDLFMKYMHDIKTKFGEKEPGYSANYKIKELLKATNLNNTRSLNKLAKTNALNWTERGPGNVSGRTRAIIVDPDDATHNTWYAGAISGGVWKTTNAGASWTTLTSNLSTLNVCCLVMASSNHDVMYMGTGEGFGNIDQLSGNGIWKTTDRGASWTQLANTANSNFSNVTRMVVDPNDANIVLAATSAGSSSGIWKSTDGGTNWTKVYSGAARVEDLIANPLKFNTLYATENQAGVIKSYDAGNTWFSSANGMNNVFRTEIAMGNTDTSKIYASTVITSGSGPSYVYVSSDGGANWTQASEASGDKNFLGGQGWYDNAIVVDPYDDNTIYVAGVSIIKYVVSGTSLTSTVIADPYNSFGGPNNSSKVHPDHHNLTVVKTDVGNQKFRLIDGNDGGVTYSDDKGGTFTKTLSGGYNTSQFYGVDKKNGADQYIGGTQDNGSWYSAPSPNSSSSWSSAPSGDGFEAAWNYSNSLQMLESSQYNHIYRSTDGGTVWNDINNPTDVIPNGSGKGPFITKISTSKLAPNLVFVMGALNGVTGISRSTDFGATWTGIAISSKGWSNSSSNQQIKISLKDPSVVWAAKTIYNNGYTFAVSTDSGKTFSQTQSSALAPAAWISGFATDPADKNTAYALYSAANSPKILKTTDLGQTWTELSGFGNNTTSSNGFPDVAVFCLLVMPTNTNVIWAGTEIGLFESRDGGANWHYANNGLPAVAIWQMKDINGQIVVATHGRGVWTVPESSVVTGIESNTSVIPTDYSLSQNYPNPFNPSTKIKFNLPSSGNVKLTIYDITGRKVKELVNQDLSAGVHTVDFDASDISSGVYLYRIQAGNFVQSKKMILMK